MNEMILETKVNLLAQQVHGLQDAVNILQARMGNLERSQERLTQYVGWQVNIVDEKEAIGETGGATEGNKE